MHHATCMSCMQGPRRKDVPSAAQNAAPRHLCRLRFQGQAKYKIPGCCSGTDDTALVQRNRRGHKPGH
ncbi:uncharacterized protein CTRU02_212996 [Colletotrichum truncatum]|uniref:Uncharacterized protein n=1 Tax=Colletotrichum truncatum TaxID=5467 RepID=A0ACC3YJF3_COLTU|nr:uncharacterized protein CTRU02_03316 [Colletotrichum truncatum]KAF6797285.1 hypothetical protein CTRU02_03316 [Colletotrichum truncatum]